MFALPSHNRCQQLLLQARFLFSNLLAHHLEVIILDHAVRDLAVETGLQQRRRVPLLIADLGIPFYRGKNRFFDSSFLLQFFNL